MSATLTFNEPLNGIEISFDRKPISATLEALKGAGFRWHRAKKLWYAKNTAERLELAQAITNINEYAEAVRKEEKPAKKAEPVNAFGVRVGDVFYNSWGYEQTNIDFWQVVALKGKTMITLRAIGSENAKDLGFCSCMVKPVRDGWTKHYDGEEITRKVQGTNENPYCHMEHGNLYKTTWDAEHNETSYY